MRPCCRSNRLDQHVHAQALPQHPCYADAQRLVGWDRPGASTCLGRACTDRHPCAGGASAGRNSAAVCHELLVSHCSVSSSKLWSSGAPPVLRSQHLYNSTLGSRKALRATRACSSLGAGSYPAARYHAATPACEHVRWPLISRPAGRARRLVRASHGSARFRMYIADVS